MGKEVISDRHQRTGGLIEYSIRKLSIGQGNSLRTRIYKRLIEEHGSIQNLIDAHKQALRQPGRSIENHKQLRPSQRTMYSIGTSLCVPSQRYLAALRLTLIE